MCTFNNDTTFKEILMLFCYVTKGNINIKTFLLCQ